MLLPPLALLFHQAGSGRTVGDNPPAAAGERPGSAAGPMAMSSEAPFAPSAGGQAFWAATIDYWEAKIFKPRTGMEDKVRLRAYHGPGMSSFGQL